MPVKSSNHSIGAENKVAEVWSEDSELCRHVVEIDPAIRVAAIVNGSDVSGFASSLKSGNILSEDAKFREKIGYWVRIVTEIARQTEPVFGELGSITFSHEKLNLVTLPISKSKSLGLSLDKSADVNHVLAKIRTRVTLSGPAHIL